MVGDIYAGFHFIFAGKIVKEKNIDNPIDNRFVNFLSGAMLLISAIVNVLYEYAAVHYLIVAAILGLMIIFRRKILNLIKEVRKRYDE